MRDPATKRMTREEALTWRSERARSGARLVMTTGCFDLLHPGHVEYLNRARGLGDALLVATNSDGSLRRLKGPSRPIFPETDRTTTLASLECVDAVVVFDGPNCPDLMEQVRPDVYAKGGDYSLKTMDPAERAALEHVGTRIVFVPFHPGYSSSTLMARLQRLFG